MNSDAQIDRINRQNKIIRWVVFGALALIIGGFAIVEKRISKSEEIEFITKYAANSDKVRALFGDSNYLQLQGYSIQLGSDDKKGHCEYTIVGKHKTGNIWVEWERFGIGPIVVTKLDTVHTSTISEAWGDISSLFKKR